MNGKVICDDLASKMRQFACFGGDFPGFQYTYITAPFCTHLLVGCRLSHKDAVLPDSHYKDKTISRLPYRNLSSVLYLRCLVADQTEWASESPKSLWQKLVKEVKAYYSYTLTE